MISDSLLNRLLCLPAEDRLDLVEVLWDSVLAEGIAPDLTSAQRSDLRLRLAEADEEPDSGSSWHVAQTRIRQRTERE